MTRLLTIVALPLLGLASACGGGDNDIVVTNENNVVLNDSLENYASVNDGEVAANDMMTNDMMANDMMMTDDTMMNDTSGNTMMMNGSGMSNMQ